MKSITVNCGNIEISNNNNICLIANGYFVGPTMNFESASGDGSICSFNLGNGVFGTTLLTGTKYTDSAGEGIFI